jgi:hypothetical protein
MPSPTKKTKNTPAATPTEQPQVQDESKTVEIATPVQETKAKRRRPKVAADSAPPTVVKNEEPAPQEEEIPLPTAEEDCCTQTIVISHQTHTSLPVNLAALALTAVYGLKLYFMVHAMLYEDVCSCSV